MSIIRIVRREFNDGMDGERELSYYAAALMRAAVAAGRNPIGPISRADQRAESRTREQLVRSSVNLRTNQPEASETYQEARGTNRAHMTEAVANALCAFSANSEFSIPWLMNIEELNRYSPRPVVILANPKSRKRTDFIGTDAKENWYVFEAKGRTIAPSQRDLGDWKKQAQTVKTINGQPPVRHILAASFLDEEQKWTQILYDPPADDHSASFEFDMNLFFVAYYARLRSRLLPNSVVAETDFGPLYDLGLPGFAVGVHRDFENAAFEGAIGNLFELSSSIRLTTEHGADAEMHLFSDGVMVKVLRE